MLSQDGKYYIVNGQSLLIRSTPAPGLFAFATRSLNPSND